MDIGSSASTDSHSKRTLRLTPPCIATKKQAAAARRRSRLIDEQLQPTPRVCAVPFFGSGEARAMVVDHFIRATVEDGQSENKAEVAEIRRQVLHRICSHMHTLHGDIHMLQSAETDEQVRSLLQRLSGACEETLEAGWCGCGKHVIEDLDNQWPNSKVQEIFLAACKLQGDITGSYLIETADRVFAPTYHPSTHDSHRLAAHSLLGQRVGALRVGDLAINILNTQRWGPKAVRRCDDYPCVVYVADLLGYARALDNMCDAATGLDSDLMHHSSLLTAKAFRGARHVLVLTKFAQFREALIAKPLKEVYSDFEGGADVDAALEYVVQKYVRARPEVKEVAVYVAELDDPDLFNIILGNIRAGLPPDGAGEDSARRRDVLLGASRTRPIFVSPPTT